jgi:hypothetical protein
MSSDHDQPTLPDVFPGDLTTTTVVEAKAWLKAHARKGVRCPACRQFVKIYRRALGSQMARWLIWLVRTWEQAGLARNRTALDPWIDIRRSPVRGGDYAKLAHWGLIEHKPNTEKKDNGAKDTRDSGMWRPTFKGLDFVQRRVTVPSHIFLYDNIRIGEETTLITIEQALGKRYSYAELMAATVNVDVPV